MTHWQSYSKVKFIWAQLVPELLLSQTLHSYETKSYNKTEPNFPPLPSNRRSTVSMLRNETDTRFATIYLANYICFRMVNDLIRNITWRTRWGLLLHLDQEQLNLVK
jgi:hypothetical protein